MYFAFNNILPVVWVCMGVALVAMIYLLTVYRSFTRLRHTSGEDTLPSDEELPGVSVIIYARDNASDLRETLPEILSQEYPEGRWRSSWSMTGLLTR